MLQSLIVTPTLLLIGWCVWRRRVSWRLRWHRSLTLSVALQGIGFTLCLPVLGPWIGKPLFILMGIAHFRDYLGHLCFISAAAAMIYAVASRMLPDRQIEPFMRRIEIPNAVAAIGMLICILSSRALKHPPVSADFFEVSRDNWLAAYWLIYMSICAYQLLWLINLLFMMREDPRNRLTATFFIAAARIGFIAIAAVVANAVSPAGLPSTWIWVPLCISSGLVAIAGGLTWSRRSRHPLVDKQLGDRVGRSLGATPVDVPIEPDRGVNGLMPEMLLNDRKRDTCGDHP